MDELRKWPFVSIADSLWGAFKSSVPIRSTRFIRFSPEPESSSVPAQRSAQRRKRQKNLSMSFERVHNTIKKRTDGERVAGTSRWLYRISKNTIGGISICPLVDKVEFPIFICHVIGLYAPSGNL